MASSITFSSVTSSIKDKCAHLVDLVVNGFNNNINTIKEITYVATIIFGATILIGLPFAFLLNHSPFVVGEPMYILAGLLMLNPVIAKVVITSFIISAVASICLTVYETRLFRAL
ncbi:MAG: hypothetical protein K1060chlam4_01125 [Candidatus Anoxychlamydiales bacterium]|nr:hypothetical protein [Candidatus Anoxychlamydiales bacterium]